MIQARGLTQKSFVYFYLKNSWNQRHLNFPAFYLLFSVSNQNNNKTRENFLTVKEKSV